MIAKCANPVCSAPFRYLREGKVFRMELDGAPEGASRGKPVHKIEHFWLCGRCSMALTLISNKGKVETIPIQPAITQTAAS